MNTHSKLRTILSLLALLVLPAVAQAQTVTPGYYFIQSKSDQSYYLCISNRNHSDDASTPYLRTKQNPNSYEIWQVQQDGDYYNIIHQADGKYVVANRTTQGGGQAVHLETIVDPSTLDEAGRKAIQFIFTYIPDADAYAIRPREAASDLSFNPNNGNGRDAGSTNTNGDIHLWTGTGSAAMQWVLVATLPPPAISCNTSAQTFTLTAPVAGATIRYTTDGSRPTASTGNVYTAAFSAAGIAAVRAVAVKDGVASPMAQLYSPLVSFVIEHKLNTGFYLLPSGNVTNAGDPYIQTYSLPRPSIAWHLEAADIAYGIQHYRIVNDSTGGYMWFKSNENSTPVVKSADDGSDEFQFSFTEIDGDEGWFLIQSKPPVSRWIQTYRWYLNKSNNYDYNNSVGYYSNSNIPGATGRWRVVGLTGATPRASLANTMGLSLSTTESVYQYKIYAEGAPTYFVVPPTHTTGTDTLVKTSNTEADNMAWIVKEASSDEWLSYYYIVNAVTGEYLYYDQAIAGAAYYNAFTTHMPGGATGVAADRFLFAFAPTHLDGYYYIVPKPIRYLNDRVNYNVMWREGTSALRVTRSRNSNAVRWGFTSVDMTVAPPVIKQSATANTITLVTTTPGATIHYTIDGSDPSSSSDAYTAPFTPSSTTTVIKAIAIKEGTASTVTTYNVLPLTGVSNQYMIQNQEFTDFYLLPGSKQNDGFMSLNTYSLLRPSMTWTFIASENYLGRQYYSIRNDSTGRYLWCNYGGTVRLKSAADYGDGSATEFKFYLLPKEDGSFWIVPKARQDYQLNKNNGNNSTDAVGLTNNATILQCRWQFVRHDQLPAPTMPFTVSTDDCAYYYRIKNAGANTFYIVPNNGSNEYANTSNAGGTNDRWFIRQVASDAWLSYYAIINAETGQCLYFNGNGTTATVNNAFVSVQLAPEAMATNDAAQFAIARTTQSASDGYYYLVPKVIRYLNNRDNYSLMWRDGTSALKTQLSRPHAERKWIFESSSFTCDAPTLTENMVQGTVTITAANALSQIYYVGYDDPAAEPDLTPATGTLYTEPFDIEYRYYKAIATRCTDGGDQSVPATLGPLPLFQCATPTITFNSATREATITCATASATIYYILDSEFNPSDPRSGATQYTGPFSPYSGDSPKVIRAIAIRGGELDTRSEVALYDQAPRYISSTSQITSMSGIYAAKEGFTATATVGSTATPFTGTFDGAMVPFALSQPLFGATDGAVVRNVIVSTATVSGSGNVGAIVGEAHGASRIYNCGVLGGSVSGTSYVGSLVGLLDDYSRVINCYSYASVSGGTDCGGLVGYNNYESKSSDIRTMVMNCMYYGESVTGTNVSPIYGGKIIRSNRVSATDAGLNNFNYFHQSVALNGTTIVYNCALEMEKRYVDRFEFYRLMLNSNRELAGWYATGTPDADHTMMAKWVYEPADRTVADPMPYPVLKPQGIYPSVINPDAAHAEDIDADNTHRNEGRKLTAMGTDGTLAVTIRKGSGGAVFTAPAGAAITTTTLTLNITDKDYDRYNFNYGKVQLPYYNQVGTSNYTGNRVVTGWKIVAITGGTQGTFSTGTDATIDAEGNITAMPYNFADRHCTNKDLYSESGRVFNQGSYWDVPDGVTAITIEPYWAKCTYLSDPYQDVTYDLNYNNRTDFAAAGVRYENGNTYSIAGSDQVVYTTHGNALTGLGRTASQTVYDYAVVLVGNYHLYTNGGSFNDDGNPYTLTSIDLDSDNEPDYSLISQIGTRSNQSPIRYDLLNAIALGMAQKPNGSSRLAGFGILRPRGWFEITNTTLMRYTEFEYEYSGRANNTPLILNGGIFEEFVSIPPNTGMSASHTNYIIVGQNAWFLLFNNGAHGNNGSGQTTAHNPISVQGGDYESFYVTGYFNSLANELADGGECYISGGRFGELAGSGMENFGGDMVWQIYSADIDNFYGGGINPEKPIKGNIVVEMHDSHVGVYCGGLKFGDMPSGKSVTTRASGCTFGTFFGAGYGGSAYYVPRELDRNPKFDYEWQTFINDFFRRAYYNNETTTLGWDGGGQNDSHQGVLNGTGVSFEYEFFAPPGFTANNMVVRFRTKYASLSLATTRNVYSYLDGCTITGNFYGGGNLGLVDGNVTSVLTDCTVMGHAFGAGFQATAPVCPVMPKPTSFPVEPYYNRETGAITMGVLPATIDYTWKHGDPNVQAFDDDHHYIFTLVELTDLGRVNGNATLTIGGNSVVHGDVFGGGFESVTLNNTSVILQGNARVHGNVFGGGNRGAVVGTSSVTVQDE